MPIRIGSSYVSEAAYEYAKAKQETTKSDNGLMKELADNFPKLNISVGTAPFSGTGLNNVAISPKILREMEQDPAKRMEYEALLYDISTLNQPMQTGGYTKVASGVIIGDDGGLRGWSISKGEDGSRRKTSPLKRNDKQNWWEKIWGQAPKKDSVNKSAQKANLATNAKKAAQDKTHTEQNFADIKGLSAYLRDNFAVVKGGMANISAKYLRECLADGEKQRKLLDNLRAADEMFEQRKDAVGFQGLKITIDEHGEMTAESSSSTVTINEGKRKRQISAAATQSDMREVLAVLENDLREVEDGLKRNMCDETEVEKAKMLIEQAKEKMEKLPDREPTPTEQSMTTINMLI